jgi:hypothetical protein
MDAFVQDMTLIARTSRYFYMLFNPEFGNFLFNDILSIPIESQLHPLHTLAA